MTIHIDTQYTENYGDEATPYWKFKGGSTIVVTFDAATLTPEQAVDAVRGQIEYANPMSTETVIGFRVMPDDALTQDESDQLEYDGRVYAPAKRIAL
jgi:hypothetical protein